MATTKENLTEEIISNARRDRKRLEAVADGLVQGFARVPSPEEQGDPNEFDPEIAAAFAEEIAKIGDSLTRVNQQLVELVKIETKRFVPAPSKLGKEDVEEVYDEIQPQEVN
jgi:hypothetical protein